MTEQPEANPACARRPDPARRRGHNKDQAITLALAFVAGAAGHTRDRLPA
jgi:hypothetical protein